METSIAQARRVLCPGCPVYPHIPDEEFHFPSCELCHWPAIGVGPVHIWRCAYCRHRNEHGGVRPRVTTALLRLADVGTAARRLEVADPLYGHYLIARPRPGPCQPRPPGRTQRAVTRSSGPHARVVRHRVPPRARAGRPVDAPRNVSRSHATWLTTSAAMGMPAAASADQYAPATPAAPKRVKFPVAA